VAAQLHLDREHPNRLVFGPDSAGLDPALDVVLVGSELRVLIKGRASNWLNNVVITSSRTRAASGDPFRLSGSDPCELTCSAEFRDTAVFAMCRLR
jgi:hypothetical protein